MSRRLVRFVVAIAAAACVWLVASTASAALAPQCDPRGAITFAPPPQLQPPEQSIDMSDDTTCVERMLTAGGVQQGNSPPPSSTASEPVAAPPTPAVVPPAPAGMLTRIQSALAPLAGVRFRLDRPPR